MRWRQTKTMLGEEDLQLRVIDWTTKLSTALWLSACSVFLGWCLGTGIAELSRPLVIHEPLTNISGKGFNISEKMFWASSPKKNSFDGRPTTKKNDSAMSSMRSPRYSTIWRN